MGRMDDIRTLLEQGKTVSEIESQGYILGTIRKVVTMFNHDKRVEELRSLRENNPDPAPGSLDPTQEPEQDALPAAQEDAMSSEGVQQLTAKLEQVIEAVKEKQHAPGLCADAACHPCLTSKQVWGAKVAEQVKGKIVGEIEAACGWAGVSEMAVAVSDLHEEWIEAGRPTTPRETVVEPADQGVLVNGVHITA